jgi:hypothetical protein
LQIIGDLWYSFLPHKGKTALTPLMKRVADVSISRRRTNMANGAIFTLELPQTDWFWQTMILRFIVI